MTITARADQKQENVEELVRVTKLLRRINNGNGPVYVRQCVYCECRADTREDPNACDGWTVVPYDECRQCNEAGRTPETMATQPKLDRATARFQEALKTIKRNGGSC